MRSKRLMSEDTLRRGLASGVAATGFAALEGAKPGRSTDSRGVVGDAGARWGDASGVVDGARTVSGSGTAGNLPGDLLRARAGALGGVAGEAAGDARRATVGEGAWAGAAHRARLPGRGQCAGARLTC